MIPKNPVEQAKALGENFETLMDRVIEAAPIAMTVPEVGMGVRVSVPMTITMTVEGKEHVLVIELFSENVIPDKPANDTLGYTPEEVKAFDGVQLCRVLTDPGQTRRRFQGVILTYQEFVSEFLKNPSFKLKLERKLDDLREKAKLGETFLQKASLMWADRLPGTTALGNPIHRC